MSLTLPTDYQNFSKNSNLRENWLYQLFNSNSYMTFDGSNDYIDLGTTTSSSSIAITSSTGITIAFWINFPTLGATEPIFRSHDHATNYVGYGVTKRTDNKIQIDWYDGSGSGGGDRRTMYGDTVLSANTWYFVVVTSTFAQATSGTKIYVNSATSDSITDGGGTAGITTPTYSGSSLKAIIGQKLPSTDIWGEFKLKNLAIWNTRLDSSDTNPITAIYNSGSFKSLLYDFGNYSQSSNLKGYWEFNNGEPSIQDLSGNGLNGTINGAVYGGFLPLATSNTFVGDVFYHGVVTKSGSIRDNINLADSSAKTSNMSINVANFKYQGSNLSIELFLGSNDYINYNVKVYSQLNELDSLVKCFQIYQGRIINFSHDNKEISIQFTEQRPWDFISIPSEKTSTSKVYIPIAYGNFEESDSSQSAQDLSETRALYPVPIDNTSGKITAVVAREYDGSSTEEKARLHHFEKDCDQFVPIGSDSSNFTDASETYQGGNAMKCRTDLFRGFKTKNKTVLSAGQWSNGENAFDSRSDESSTYAEYTKISTLSDVAGGTIERDIEFTPPNIVGLISEIKVFTRYRLYRSNTDIAGSLQLLVGSTNLDTITSSFSSSILTDTYTLSGAELTSHYTNNNNQLPNIKYRVSWTADTEGETVSLRIYDCHIIVKVALDTSDESKESSKQYLNDLEYMYVGASGLTESYSGSNGEIEHGHEVLRDMLVRYTGMDTADPDGWSALNTDRNTANWKIRWWALEPTELKPILEKLMYEFGFIFKFRADATSRVIYIKKSSELSSNQELTKTDIKNIKISTSAFSDMVTKMNINYEKHPANNKYLSNVTSYNDSNRTKYKIKLKENIKDVKLDMNVGTPSTTANADCNYDFYSYYNNIVGDIKKIITCEIVNKSKAYALETGDIVTFDDLPVNPFGHSWSESGSQYYMITSLNRNINSIQIECREIG